MGGGRKNMIREAAAEEELVIKDGQSIMQVVSLRGSNLIEVIDAQGGKSLALFPAKFSKTMWIKRGSFVVVDESAKEKALESGSKVACIVFQVLLYRHVRKLQKSSIWPEAFKSSLSDVSLENPKVTGSEQEENYQLNSNDEEEDDDDALPPLEPNTNRIMPPKWQSDSETESDSDS